MTRQQIRKAQEEAEAKLHQQENPEEEDDSPMEDEEEDDLSDDESSVSDSDVSDVSAGGSMTLEEKRHRKLAYKKE